MGGRVRAVFVRAAGVWATPNRYRLVVLFGAFVMVVNLATRLALVALQGALTVNGPTAVVEALAIGSVLDAIAVAWLCVPSMIFLLLAPEWIFSSRAQRWLFWPLAGAVIFGILFTAAAELFFFMEFNSRFNFVAVDYLMYPTEVLGNIWQSYPTATILGAIAVVTVLLLWSLRRPLSAAWREPTPRWVRWATTLVFGVVLVASTRADPNSLARISDDRALNEIAGNGYASFWGSLLGSRASYAGLYAERADSKVFDRLRELLTIDPGAAAGLDTPRSTERLVRGAGPARSLNVVVVLEESLGSEYIGALRSGGHDLTPNFDALATEGTLLTNAYSTGNRTVRAIEATTSSLPPLPGASIVRRPQSKNLFTLPTLLRERGYGTAFIYGGRALFDGMGGYLSRNGVDRIVDQDDYPDDLFRTAWGVADEAIFDRALIEMDALHREGRPFYCLILTVSNHRPFTFPTDHVKPDPDLWGRENAIRYADWALGRFMRQARSTPFFEDTLFVLMGDHGARVYGSADIPLASYQVPILFLAPAVVAAGRRLDTLASTMDVPPTILGVLGASYTSKFFGQDVFAIDPERGRALMNHNSNVALMRGGRLAVLGLHSSTRLFERGDDGEFQLAMEVPDAAGRELIEDAIAYYQSASELYMGGEYQVGSATSTASEVAPAPIGGPLSGSG